MIIYRHIKVVLLASFIVSFCAHAQDIDTTSSQPLQKPALGPQKKRTTAVASSKPALEPQLKKVPLERTDNQRPGMLNYVIESSSDDYDEDWDADIVPEQFRKGISRDVAEMGSGIKDAIQKHNFSLGTHPYSIQGIPILYTSKSTGFNAGVRLSLADLKNEDPYAFLFAFQFWATDRGAKNHEISLDIPAFFSRHWGLKFSYKYSEVIDNNFFGIGNESVYNQDLITPKTPSFISRTYYQYVFTYPQFALDLSYKFFREKMSIYAGLGIERASIDPLTKDRTSKIFTEQPFGYSGGKANYIKGGIRYDGRDYPLNPSKGIVLSGTYTNHAKFLDSDFNYSSVDLTYIGFFSFLKYFVIGHRVMIDQMWGTLPFFALAEFNSYDNYQGLGGQDTLRGAPTFRFIDNLKFVSQLELRTRFYNGSVFGQHMELFLIPYWDIGRVWDRQKRVTFDQMHNAFGNEFRFTWNTTFIASFTMGFSSNNFSTYLTFGESFN